MPRLLSIIATIGTALVWHTYWALVVGILINRILGNILSYTFHPHRPRLTLTEWRALTGFSMWSWFITLVATVRDRIEMFILGRAAGSEQVGVFTVAMEIAILPWTEFMYPLTRVLFAAFSRAAADPADTERLFLRFLGISAIVVIPAGAGLAVLAEPIIAVALGPRWLPALGFLQLVAVGGVLTSFGFIGRALLEARGFVRKSFWITSFTTGIRLTLGIALIPTWGLIGAGLSAVIAQAVDQTVMFFNSGRLLRLPVERLIATVWRPCVGSICMTAVLVTADMHHPDLAAPKAWLFGGVIIGVIVYTVVVLLAWFAAGRPVGSETDILNLVNEKWQRVRTAIGTVRSAM